MVKTISYAVSRPFQRLFIILGVLAYVGDMAPYILMLRQDHAMFQSAANTTLLIASTILPLLVAGAAVALTRRRGLDALWIATGTALIAAALGQLFMWVGSIITPTYYIRINIAALALGALVALGGVWLDRRAWRPKGIMQEWRILGSAALVVSMLIIVPIADVFRSTGYGQSLLDGLQSLGWSLLAMAAVVAVTLLIFRRMPRAARIKRVLLVFASVMFTGMIFSGLMSIAQLRELDWLVPAWLVVGMMSVVYVASIWLLRPVRQPRTLRTS